jgi:transcriptional regulator with XRE-family HTH domain
MQDDRFFSINIRRLREAKGLSQAGLADLAKVSEHTIFRAESKNIIPRGSNIKKIADALGVSKSDLFQDPKKNGTKSKDIEAPEGLKNEGPFSSDDLKLIREAATMILKNGSPKPPDRPPPPGSYKERLAELLGTIDEKQAHTLFDVATGLIEATALDKPKRRTAR